MTKENKDTATEQKAEDAVEKTEETSPKWAIELGAKIDKFTDAVTRLADVTKQEEPEEEPKEEEKQEEEEEKPVEEEEEKTEKQDEEEEEKPEEEEKADTVTKAEALKMVEDAVKKVLATPSIKKSLVPKTVEQVFPTYAKISKMSWAELEEQAQKLGAPVRRY